MIELTRVLFGSSPVFRGTCIQWSSCRRQAPGVAPTMLEKLRVRWA